MADVKNMAQKGPSKRNGGRDSPVANTAGENAASLVSALRIGDDDDVPKRQPKPKMRRKWVPAGLPEAAANPDLLAISSDDARLRENFQSDSYPYDHRLRVSPYEAQKAQLQVELLKVQAWVKETGQRIIVLFRGTRRGRQGRHDQALHGAPQSTRCACRGAREADRKGAGSVVLPALYRTLPHGRRDRHVRPVLVQPRWR
jgi:hypothetical protein